MSPILHSGARPAPHRSAAPATRSETPKTESFASVLQLQRLAGNAATLQALKSRLRPVHAAGVVQRASDYSGLLPKHDSYKQSYTFDGSEKDDFTYHHIIPENLLNDVLKKLKAIFEANPEDQELNEKKGAVEANAKAQWRKTRAQDLAFQVNKLYPGHIQVSASEMETCIGQSEALQPIYQAVKTKVKEKIAAVYRAKCTEVKRALTNMLKGESFLTLIYNGPLDSIVNVMQPILDQMKVDAYGAPPVTADACAAALKSELTKQTIRINRGKLLASVIDLIEAAGLEAFVDNNFPDVTSTSVATDTLLKAVRDNGLPNADHNDDVFGYAVKWNPGNIHRGPKSDLRISGGSEHDPLVDDGGDSFEKAAVNLVSPEHYKKLHQLHENVQRLLGAEEINEETVQIAKAALEQMSFIQSEGLTQFDKSEWEESIANNEKIMRLKRDESKIAAAADML